MDLEHLQSIYLKPGKVEYLSIRRRRVEPVETLDAAQALQDLGLEGDHYANPGGNRQVTLIQAEHLHVLAAMLDMEISAGLTRRNIVVSGLNLLALKGKRFAIGGAIFEYSGECHPCSRMEETMGTGAYNAMRGHGGITARVIQSGFIRIGDRVCVLLPNTEN